LVPARLGSSTPGGFIEVTPTLQLPGHSKVFALGDVSTLSPKMAGYARVQAELVASNVSQLAASNVGALIDGKELKQAEPMPEVILVTVGPDGGAAQLPEQDDIAGAETASQYKSRDMMVDRFRAMFDAAQSSE
jgi:NADH dehydrogenase FAD-containing subunit